MNLWCLDKKVTKNAHPFIFIFKCVREGYRISSQKNASTLFPGLGPHLLMTM
jgi:hypothetical protein